MEVRFLVLGLITARDADLSTEMAMCPTCPANLPAATTGCTEIIAFFCSGLNCFRERTTKRYLPNVGAWRTIL